MRLLALILAALPLWGLSNAVTIQATNEVSASQVHRRARWFAQGEIANYPQPFVANVAPATWQAEVKNRWPDGSVRFAIISFPSFVAAASSVVVDFRNSTNACHLGNQATCEAAALTGQQMLDFNGGTWAATITATADPQGGTTQRSAAARTMLANGHFTYWIRGPVETVVVAEHRDYDFGWLGTGCTAPYTSCTWADDTTHRSLHPIFVLSFPTGWEGVKVEYIVANYWTTTRQDQRYNVTLSTSSGTVHTQSGVRGISGGWWRKVFWDGATPVATNTDFNLEYLRHSKMIPPYRYPFGPITETAALGGTVSINGTLSNWSTYKNSDFPFACTLIGTYCGNRTRGYSATGGRQDRGFYPLWEAQWLYTQRADLFDVVIGNAEYVASQPHHFRELATGLQNYHGSTAAQGMPLSLNTRPSTNIFLQGFQTIGLPAAVGPISSAQDTWRGWAADGAHRHTHTQLAYLVTGDWFFMQEQVFLAHHILFWTQLDSHTPGTRKNTWGFVDALESNHRQMGWHFWNLWRASLLAPDADPQRDYLRTKLTDALAITEGYYSITDGDYYEPCSTSPYDPVTDTSRWCKGKMIEALAYSNPNRLSSILGSTAQRQDLNTTTVRNGSSPWMDTYVALAFFDMCRTEGLGCPIARSHAERYEQATTQAGSNPRTLIRYHAPVRFVNNTTLTANIDANQTTIPVADASVCAAPPLIVVIGNEVVLIVAKDGNNLIAGTTFRGGRGYGATTRASASSGATVQCPRHATSWAEATAAYTLPSADVLIRHTELMADGGSYAEPVCGAARWSSDFLRTARASEVWEANCHTNEAVGITGIYSSYSDPRWLFDADRPIHQVRVAVSGSTATLSYVAPTGGACRVYVGSAAPATSDDSGDGLDSPSGRQHTFTATGLSSGTNHYRISCGTVRATGTFSVP